MNRIFNKKSFLLTLDIIIVMCFVMCFLPWHSVLNSNIDLSNMLSPPSYTHPLGTDSMGRDLLLRLVDMIHYEVVPLWSMVLVSSVLGILLGVLVVLCSASDTTILSMLSKVIIVTGTILSSIPAVIIALASAAYFEKIALMSIVIPLSILFCFRIMSQIINQYNQDKNLLYWKAQESFGGSVLSRVFKYGLCNSWKENIVHAVIFNLRAALAIEASISYLGFGIQEPTPSFGNILSSHFSLFLKGDIYILTIVIICFVTVSILPNNIVRLWKSTRDCYLRRFSKLADS